MAVAIVEAFGARTRAAVVAAPERDTDPVFQDLLKERMTGAKPEEVAQERPAERENRAEEPKSAPEVGAAEQERGPEESRVAEGTAPPAEEPAAKPSKADDSGAEAEEPVRVQENRGNTRAQGSEQPQTDEESRGVEHRLERTGESNQQSGKADGAQVRVPIVAAATGAATPVVAPHVAPKPAGDSTSVGARRVTAKSGEAQVQKPAEAPAAKEPSGEAPVREVGTPETPEKPAPFSPNERFTQERREGGGREARVREDGSTPPDQAQGDGARNRAPEPLATKPMEPLPLPHAASDAAAAPAPSAQSPEASSTPGAAGRVLTLTAVTGSEAGTAAKASQTPPTLQFEQLQGDPFLAQVGAGLGAALRQRGGLVTMRLHPASLGQLRIRMELEAGRVNVRFEASSEPARRLLEEQMHTLRSALEARGLRVEGLEVRVPDGQEARDRQEAGDSAMDRGTQDPYGGAGGNGERETGSEHPDDGKGFPGSDGGTRSEGARGVSGAAAGVPARGVHIVREGGGPTYRLRLDAVA